MKETDYLPEVIATFLKSQSLITLASCERDVPYCAYCFYSFEPGQDSLVFKSDKDSRHIKEGLINSRVAGTVAPPSLKFSELTGLQFQGTLSSPSGSALTRAKLSYYKKYPLALAMPGHLWLIHLDYIKMTDNRIKFGHKTIWDKLNQPV
ncbi:MAG: pyridoxamine 5'-phosphate oxidase family protein [Bacteroidia bacterium]